MSHDYGFDRGDRYGQASPSRPRHLRGGSTHAAGYVPGMEWEEGDEELLEPATGWSGSRGVRPKFGRLYRHEGDRLEDADAADPDVLVGGSGSSGYRGGRPFFGADEKMRLKAGQLEYEGPQLGGIVLGLAGIALLFRVLSSSGR